MYNEDFRLKFPPFSIAPDPRYLYLSPKHREALGHLIYGIHSDGGLVLLTGEVGTGKTTICRCLLEQLSEQTDVAFLLNPKLNTHELLASICEEYGLDYPEGNSGIKNYVDVINNYLLKEHAAGRHCILIIDEAQNLSTEVLEQLRLLTNLETNERKLLQIILIGQPELRQMLALPELRQLSQRITARYHLTPLTKDEIASYISHRLSVAGASRQLYRQLFSAGVIKKIFEFSGGVPRLINLICDRALLGVSARGVDKLTKKLLCQAADEVLGSGHTRANSVLRWGAWIITAFTLMVAGVGINYSLGIVPVAEFLSSFTWVTQKEEGRSSMMPPVNLHGNEALGHTESMNSEKQLQKVTPLPIPPLLKKWPEKLPANRGKKEAFQVLLSLWGVPHDIIDSKGLCDFAELYQLNCLHMAGSFESMLFLNRPAMLALYDESGEEYFATITAVSKGDAEFVIGEEHFVVSISELWSRWYGDYMILWKEPPEYSSSLQPGNSGKAVKWVARSLARLSGRALPSQNVWTLNEELTVQIKRFQFAKHLVSDGVVGPQTIIHLNTAVNALVPLLVSKEEGV